MDGQVGEEGFDFGDTHLLGVAFVVEEDEAFDPANVCLFGADGVMLAADGITHLIEEFLGAFLRGLIHRVDS